MKKTVFKTMLVAGVLLTAGYLFNQHKEAQMNEMIFANIEALANNEDESLACAGSGSIDCMGYKYKIKITGLSLR